MTNADYIRQHITDVDISKLLFNQFLIPEKPTFSEKAYNAWKKWADSTTSNHGNIAGRPDQDDPSVWFWERWRYPGNIWKRMGRTRSVSVQVWLSKQYNPEEWEGDDE